mmetsp:Transcript_29852/g.48117  ORF Transcript_29852/g.48117 Transcript_29852/m.48117 type:complete len:375 (+) Transcript_29852:199-1323(+)
MGANESICGDCSSDVQDMPQRKLVQKPVAAFRVEGPSTNVKDDDAGGFLECHLCKQALMSDQSLKKLPCTSGHVFHSGCIDTWLQNSEHCPVDMQKIQITATTSSSGPCINPVQGIDANGASISPKFATLQYSSTDGADARGGGGNIRAAPNRLSVVPKATTNGRAHGDGQNGGGSAHGTGSKGEGGGGGGRFMRRADPGAGSPGSVATASSSPFDRLMSQTQNPQLTQPIQDKLMTLPINSHDPFDNGHGHGVNEEKALVPAPMHARTRGHTLSGSHGVVSQTCVSHTSLNLLRIYNAPTTGDLPILSARSSAASSVASDTSSIVENDVYSIRSRSPPSVSMHGRRRSESPLAREDDYHPPSAISPIPPLQMI